VNLELLGTDTLDGMRSALWDERIYRLDRLEATTYGANYR
jgi:hypothetical protein